MTSKVFLHSAVIAKRNKCQKQCNNDGTIFCTIDLSSFGEMLEESYLDGLEPVIQKIKNDYHFAGLIAIKKILLAAALLAGNVRKVTPFIKKDRPTVF